MVNNDTTLSLRYRHEPGCGDIHPDDPDIV
jgi:hypothetical protein